MPVFFIVSHAVQMVRRVSPAWYIPERQWSEFQAAEEVGRGGYGQVRCDIHGTTDPLGCCG
jgi:hypothetical protein